MVVYIKKHADFSLVGKADAESWNLPLEAVGTEGGSIVITGENRECVGDWLCLFGKVVYITQASPKDGKTTLATSDPYKYFDRQLFFPAEPAHSYGEFIKNALEREFLNCSDEAFRLPYLRVTNTDNTTLVKPDLDETNLYHLSNVIASARRRGVVVEFSLGTTNAPADTLDVNIYTSNGKTRKVLFNDGHAQLSSETYSQNGIAKITIMQEYENEDKTKGYNLFDFYLAADGSVTNTPPANRAPGKWEYATCQATDVPLRRAAALFSDNLQSHKIEFDADYLLRLYDPIVMRLSGTVYSSSIIYVGVSDKDSRYHYKCGELAVTLTDKVRAAASTTQQSATQSTQDISGKADKSEIPQNVSDLSNDSGFTTLASVYPVGSIYMSVNSVDPSTLFGGTWEQLKDHFLLAAGDSFAAGSTGGEATHTLTEDEMPRHNHSSNGSGASGSIVWTDGSEGPYDGFAFTNWARASSRTDLQIAVAANGNNAAHNNMPPYIAVYVWKRTA